MLQYYETIDKTSTILRKRFFGLERNGNDAETIFFAFRLCTNNLGRKFPGNGKDSLDIGNGRTREFVYFFFENESTHNVFISGIEIK